MSLPAALAALTTAVSPTAVPFGPRGHAVTLETLARSVEAELIATIELDGVIIVALRRSTPDPVSAAWVRGLASLRLDLSQRLLALAGKHLGERDLLQRQLVQGAVAEILTEHLEVRAALDGAERLLPTLHQKITQADRAALRLLGASGFLADGPGQTVHVSELLADAYVPGEL